jgi:hypothetical protein
MNMWRAANGTSTKVATSTGHHEVTVVTTTEYGTTSRVMASHEAAALYAWCRYEGHVVTSE